MNRPLSDIRILDLTAAWAGPLASRLLAALGAEVIKVEGPGRLDLWRGQPWGGVPHRYPDKEIGERPHNRNAWFNSQNHDKMAVSLDLKDPRGREVALRLAARCHVVLANFPPGVLDRLGLGYEELRKVRPDIVLVEMPAFGQEGPESHYVAWGPNLEGAMGGAALQGYAGGPPLVTGYAIVDPISGAYGAAATVTAIVHWRRTGEGQRVEVAQLEAAMHYLGEYILEAASGAPPRERMGNDHPTAAPHGAFRCAGADEWVAVACFTDQQWQNLCQVTGRPELASDPRFADSLTRWQNRAEACTSVGAWTLSRDKHDAAARLQAVGVPAGAVANARDLDGDSHLHARGFFTTMTLPDVGTHRYPGLPFHVDGAPCSPSQPSPVFGQHNRQVFQGILGMPEAEYQELVGAGVITDQPR
jgi:crotonobetainyl-CoA:carnitine CoA-transferase CaiB-like acyl-CoA transferase